MAFDQTTRNRLQKFVLEARDLLKKEFIRQMQHDFGMNPESGKISDIEKLVHLDDARQETARMLRDTFAHYMAAQPFGGEKGTLDRIVREQAFTVLNRLCAVRMAEARGFLIESVANGYQSKGFQLYDRLAGHSLGEMGEAYQCYLFSLFDEFSVDLPVLFDRYSAMGRLFPKDTALRELLDLINAPDIAHLWAEDETIGWIYQYFNSKEERRQMRDASQAPRNSRELAVRNQFFTPRYVVEFLTDNTLGRIWYEMTQGNTALAEDCQYLVRRPNEVFLSIEQGPVLDWFQGNAEETEPQISNIARSVNGYLRAGGLHEWAQGWLEQQIEAIKNNQAESFSTQIILDVLFVIHQMDRFCEGTIEKYQKEIDSLMAILRQRVEENQKEDLSQEALLKQPVFIPLRPVKDPRDIKILDPACGSGHFLLYAFDLLETIYKEYWDIEAQAEYTREKPPKELSPLKELYESKDALIADLPRLVIEYNLHGIDIDPRAVQIAGLSLWLRAQRGWQEKGIKLKDRPAIQKSNIVCAEPMPGETDMLREFTDSLKPKVLGQLVEIIFEKMELAGEAGPLLKIEEEIADAVDNAREEFNKELLRRKEEEKDGYLPDMAPKKRQMSLFDFSDLPDKTRFWEMAEDKILGALKDYAEHVENGDNSRRRLFAKDTAKGFAFIDLCRKRYDAVLMNPPFGEPSLNIASYFDQHYQYWTKNLLCTSIIRANDLLLSEGRLGVIFDRTAAIKSSYKNFRKKHLVNKIKCVADTGWNVLDANVETTVHIINKKDQKEFSQFFDVRDFENKSSEILNKIKNYNNNKILDGVYSVKVSNVLRLPNSVVGYYFDDFLINLFNNFKNLVERGLQARQGHALVSEQHFRLFWEVPDYIEVGKNKPYAHLYNGGDFSLFTSPYRDFTKYGHMAKFLKANKSVVLRNMEYQFSHGVGYGKRGEIIDAHILNTDTIFTSEGQAFTAIEEHNALFVLSFLNSSLAQYTINQYCGQHKHCGYINLLPFPLKLQDHYGQITSIAEGIINIKKKWFMTDETTLEFQNIFLNVQNSIKSSNFKDLLDELSNCYLDDISSLNNLIIANDEIFEQRANLTPKQRLLLKEYIKRRPKDFPSPDFEKDRDREKTTIFWCKLFLLYILGCSFGRWNICRIHKSANEDDLFSYWEKLPTSPPGMLQNSEGFPAEPKDVPADYPLRITWNGILVDDEGHPEDIIARVREAIEVIWKEKAEDIEQEAIEILGVNSLREYFSKPGKFFADHLKRYSKSRRQAPIYWPLSTASGSYTLWLYYHRLTDQILYTSVNDYVEPKIKELTNNINALQAKHKRSWQEEKQLEYLSDFTQELVDFRDELLRVAKFWKPDLNDGVQITAAPLWQLFRHRPWQNKLKDTWQKLEKGDYDWAHLAFSIWPERVVKAAQKDRSIAIAHDLEEDLWEEVEVSRDRRGNPKYQWQPRDLSQKEVVSVIQSASSDN